MQRLAVWTPPQFLQKFHHEAQTVKFLGRIQDSTQNILVATDTAGIPAGVIGGKRNTEEPQEYDWKIYGFYVMPAHERQGIGSALLIAFLDGLRRVGAQRVIVFTFAANAPARRIYERYGGVLTHYNDSPDIDLKIPHVSYGFDLRREESA